MKLRRPATSAPTPSGPTAPKRAAASPAPEPKKPRRTGNSEVSSADFSPLSGKSKSVYTSAGFDTLLDRATHSRNTAGNKVTMLFDGVNSFAARDKLIDGAKDSIHLQTFIFASDDTGWDLAKRLAKKAQEGVSVRVVYDGIGSNRADKAMFEFMQKAGVQVREYADPVRQFWDLNDRWHEKHLIVDGKASIEGGMNVANEYALGGSARLVYSRGEKGIEPWRDADVQIEGPGVADTQTAFLKNWKELGKDVTAAERARLFPTLTAQPGGATVRMVQERPEEDGQPNIEAIYLHSINAAKKSISIENAYFVPSKPLREALAAAARRGVDVTVMTNSRASNDFAAVTDCSRYFYDAMISAGVKIHERQGSTLHSKTATFDGQFSLVGSANLNGRSSGRDSEFVVAIQGEGTAVQLEQRFAQGLKQTQKVTAKELQGEGFFTNLRQWAFSTLAWTF